MAHPCDDQKVSISVRDLAALLNVADFDPDTDDRLARAFDSYEDMLTRMANGSTEWKRG